MKTKNSKAGFLSGILRRDFQGSRTNVLSRRMIKGHVVLQVALVFCVLLSSAAIGMSAEGGLDAIKKVMGDGAVKITKKSTLCDATDKVPSLGETWTF